MYKYLLLPSTKQWKKWSLPSKLTAVSAFSGLLFGIISTIDTLWSSDLQVKNSIEKVLLNRQREIRGLPSLQARFKFSPDLSTRNGIKEAVDELNDYGIANYQFVNSEEINRVILEYGAKQMHDEFWELRNGIHYKTKNLTNYLVSTINGNGPKGVKESNLWLKEYVMKINHIQNAYAEYYGYINSLSASQFNKNG